MIKRDTFIIAMNLITEHNAQLRRMMDLANTIGSNLLLISTESFYHDAISLVFKESLRDLDQNVHHERVILDSQSDISQILTLDLSLHQLLNIRLLSLTNHSSKCEMEFAFPVEIVNEVSTQIRQHL